MFNKKEYDKKYREINRKNKREYDKEYNMANKEKIKEKNRKCHLASKEKKKLWREANKEKVRILKRGYKLKAQYGLLIEDYNKMYESQKGLCAICGEPEVKIDYRTTLPVFLSVDHNHDTGQIRELLCQRCNFVLGKCEEDLDIFEKMQSYLIKHKLP